MKYALKDYQADAVTAMLERLTDARDDVTRSRPRNVSFSLAATTGVGKTVIATAVLESLLFGNPHLDIELDPTAVVLWLTAAPVDPHGYHLADAVPKLRGLASFAVEYGDEFHRIESVVEITASCAASTSRTNGYARPTTPKASTAASSPSPISSLCGADADKIC